MHTPPTPPSLAALARSGHCTRYERNGSRCHRPTRRNEWCGACAGFLRPHRQERTDAPQPARPPHQWFPLTTETLPLTPEKAYDPKIQVTRSAIDQYRAKHGGDTSTAETEIRCLLKNLISTGKHQRFENGTWRLLADERFAVLLSADAARVISYSTPHGERTYAQVKAGVPSRSRRKEKGWVRELQTELPIRYTNLVLRRFAREVLDTEFTRSTGRKVVEAAHARGMQVQPDRPLNGAGRRRMTDGEGLKWHFVYSPGERPTVVHLSWKSGWGSEAAARAEAGR
ncbi:hypothetical protein ACFYO5_34565 [Streptomyces sp. NPDC006259]|uniref:hypothetical protein n=1 Tax=Streptomyces sp. NPDC006259 TaxID=3364740 RepID=UPI0036BE2AB3